MFTKYCLRCETSQLTVLPESNDQATFYECPSCHRNFAQEPGRGLCDRWLSPISLVLYGVQLEPKPQANYQRVAQSLLHDRSREEIAWMVEEIEHELRKPTQQVRDILSLPHDEEDLRDFLRLVVDYWKA
jgi:transposase-like protein